MSDMGDQASDTKGAAPGEKVITHEELGRHIKESDVWLAIHGKVYDVTSYLADHPGGMDVMLEHAGKDATEEFEYYGHSDKARQQLKEFLVGTYEKGDSAPVAEASKTSSTSVAKPSTAAKVFQALLPLLLIAFAVLYKVYMDRTAPKAA